jgi:hypothetical protein
MREIFSRCQLSRLNVKHRRADTLPGGIRKEFWAWKERGGFLKYLGEMATYSVGRWSGCASSSSSVVDESSCWELNPRVLPSFRRWPFRVSPLLFRYFVYSFGVTEGARDRSAELFFGGRALPGRGALVSEGIEPGPCTGRVKRSLADGVSQQLGIREVEAPSPSPLGFRLLLPSLPDPWRSLRPTSQILSVTRRHSFSLRFLCSSGSEQRFIITAEEAQKKHKEKPRRS